MEGEWKVKESESNIDIQNYSEIEIKDREVEMAMDYGSTGS